MNSKFTSLLLMLLMSAGAAYAGVQQHVEGEPQEKQLYATDFTDWPTIDRKKATDEVVEVKTKYSKETLTFTLNGVGADPAGNQSKFAAYTGYMVSAKYPGEYSTKEPSVVTSPLASVTKFEFTQAATGGSRGWVIAVKGDGDDDWVTLFNQSIATQSGETHTLEVNRTNVQLRFTNFNLEQNAYMVDMKIYGLVDLSGEPSLDQFTANGVTYTAGDIFTQDDEGNYQTTIELSKAVPMVSEDNPLTDVTAAYGEVGDITYTPDGDDMMVTIPVTADETTILYVATFTFKPDYTLTYYNTDGTAMGTQQVEKDASISTFAFDYADAMAANGQKVRGWFVSAEGGRKLTVDEVIVDDMDLFAVATDIETMSPTARYTFNLKDPYFYADDHEAFNPIGNGKFHDTTHGWDFVSGDKIELLVGGKAQIILSLCAYSKGNAITLTDADGNLLATIENDKAATDGQQQIFDYDGEAAVLTVNFGGTSYLHQLTIMNLGEPPFVQQGNWYEVKAGDVSSLLSTLDIVNAKNSATDAQRSFIFLPNGLYDLGDAVLTTVSGHNISIVGESRDGVVIKNTPTIEGIQSNATLRNMGTQLYLQDLTLQNDFDYYNAGGKGVAVALWERNSSRTICKNVRLLSYQDTYYSNSDHQFYFEGGEIHGCVDFLCGSGDVYFNGVTFVCESRSATQPKNGSATIAAPNTAANVQTGYVMNGCTIDNRAKDFNLGRAWDYKPKLTYLNTIMLQPDEIIASRFTPKGMNVVADDFNEYRSVDSEGNVVSPASNIVSFSHGDVVNEQQTILSDEEASAFALDKVFADWQPSLLTVLLDAPVATLADGKLSWEPVEGATAYAIFRNDVFEALVVDATEYAVATDEGDILSIKAANAMGGFGLLSVVGESATAIYHHPSPNTHQPSVVYNLNGQRVNSSYRGVVVMSGRKVVQQ
ncbi:MAG: pectin esterase [Prevotella sp.]|nr:pectin esterase [Prevotella sp.]